MTEEISVNDLCFLIKNYNGDGNSNVMNENYLEKLLDKYNENIVYFCLHH